MEDVERGMGVAEEVISNEEMDVEEVEKQPISLPDAQPAFTIMRQFLEGNSVNLAMIRHIDELDDYLYDERRKKQKQSKLTKFLMPYP